MADVRPLPAIPVERNGLPRRHWAGRVEAAKVLREHFNVGESWLTPDEATDITEAMLRAYLNEQR